MTGSGFRSIDRRRLLGLLGAGAAVGIAGCLGGNAGDGENGDDGPSYAPNVDEHPGDEPIEFEADHNCVVCNMTVTDYGRWMSQFAHEDGTGAVFDTPGCLFAYVVATSSDSPTAGAWVTDFETQRLVDATEAHFVLVTDADAADDPMGINPRPFADYDDAVDYLETWDAEDLTEEDVVGLKDVDHEVASIYRGNRLPDE